MRNAVFPLLFIIGLLFPLEHFAQVGRLSDSLENVLRKRGPNEDTATAMLYYRLSKSYWSTDTKKSRERADSCLSVSSRIGFRKGIACAYLSMGVLYDDASKFNEAISNYEKAHSIFVAEKNTWGISAAVGNTAIVYYRLGKYPEALKCHIISLQLSEQLGDEMGVASSHNNMGVLYVRMKNKNEAIKNYDAALVIYKKLNNIAGISRIYNNMGLVYESEGNDSAALRNYLLSLDIKIKNDAEADVDDTYMAIGQIYYNRDNCALERQMFEKSLHIRRKLGSQLGMAESFNNLGMNYLKEKNFKLSLLYLDSGLVISKKIQATDKIAEAYLGLADTYEAAGDFSKAYANRLNYERAKDSLLNVEKIGRMATLKMSYDFDKVEAQQKAEQDKKDALAAEALRRTANIRNFSLCGVGLLLIFLFVVYGQRNRIAKEKKRSDDLLLNILPEETAEELKNTGEAKAKSYADVSVLFTDFKNFTTASEHLSAEEVVREINYCYSAFDDIVTKYKIEKIKTIGDSYMAAAGLPAHNPNHAKDIVNAAIEIRDFMNTYKMRKQKESVPAFEIRIGVHSGPVVAGVVGTKKFAYDIWGDTVNTASRMESSGETGKVNISQATHERTTKDFLFTPRGKIETKGKGLIEMYFADSIQ